MTDPNDTKGATKPGAPKLVRALIDGNPATSFADMKPGVELSFDDEVRAGDVILFGAERYRAVRGAGGNVELELIDGEERDDR